ncbi:hypothetical protein BDV39DRAFT_197707 [Aspergillus sergii]|uniref:Uncharacterized protein n=1 Tax=Aspergillus sergii TaxID=1034303 RepID=A0A5N6WKM5_9EURO|nr:hypothetical protein BDV39DRAFT_197707 [Aspergillus sergii]
MTAVLITGVTGKQGGSLIKSLISRNAPFEILAVTRNPISTSVQKLRNLSPSIKLRLTSSSIWGKSLIDEALKQNVKFFVYSSVDRGGEEHSYTNLTKIPYFIKKHNIEYYFVDCSKNTSMEWTILRPTVFYENLTPDFFGKKRGELLPMAFWPVCLLFMVMMRDMGYMFRWFHEEGYGADVMALREVHPNLKDFGTWLEMESGFGKR